MTAQKKRPRGRPKLPRGQDREVVLTIRLRPNEQKKLRQAAKRAEKSVSAWARSILLDQADMG